ncbi:ABC-type Fe3+-hydroxamate transport system, substrate-binding protein [Polaribacter sp. KT25b]|uniref:ABC transporter substrate-binding protein n=1 Tax=Polaribacter sp. KT25b TaxID=1855336 RepID=UPI00087B0B23|nr:helical backbone metal receptor [Polaribacter sp. KT25b]SDS29118.1 ABC-type Fe3+-hydroxamate transport system, substrate-binding protein [Polaribacter sp. KT25b]
MQVQDQIGRILEFEKTPKRIVCLVPSLTELLVDLGLEDSIVGLTKFCIHPMDLKQTKTIVGGTKSIHAEKIKALEPDIILCNKEENSKEIVEICSKIAPTHVSDIFTIDDNLELIKQYGKLFSVEKKALDICIEINLKLTDFNQFIKNKGTKKVVYFIWKDPWMAAGNTTFINHLLQLNKFDNIYQNKERYPEVNLEEMKLNNQLDFILLSSEPFPFGKDHILEIEKFTSKAKAILVDGEMFSWTGSRLLKAFDYFKSLH